MIYNYNNEIVTVSLTVSSLKGNTLGILEELDERLFSYAERLKRQPIEVVESIWDDSDIIMIGTSTYASKYDTEISFPAQLRRYYESLKKLEGKDIVLFGSGRSEYPLYCGGLDYLEEMLEKKNNIIMNYKFEGYPRQSEKLDFKEEVEEIIYEAIEVRERELQSLYYGATVPI